ncbi:hypothetical protein D3C80_2010900 [compost metagenome]
MDKEGKTEGVDEPVHRKRPPGDQRHLGGGDRSHIQAGNISLPEKNIGAVMP